MASHEHLRLSNVIKTTHQNLKEESTRLGFEQAWKKHCEDINLLNRYSKAMQDLATLHWEKNNETNPKAQSRVDWVHRVCVTYFANGELVRQREREKKIATKIGVNLNLLQYSIFDSEKLRLLDVGSCYNPFKKFTNFDVLPVDIAAANDEVYLCDFLKVQVGDRCFIHETKQITSLKRNSFDIVVFSLVLEYFPCPLQRLLCCTKAYQLLNTEGLLLIITPDSKHVGANAKLMKSWRFILANMGFSRIKYEKLPHIHCMAFRKSITLEIASRWAQIQDSPNKFLDKMVIPQDFNRQKETSEKGFNESDNVDDRADLFKELPNIY